jgi:hypothetical protein
MSPRKGTSPMPKSSTILNNIFALTGFGRPPSTCWHVLKTIIAMNASITSPILERRQSANRMTKRKVSTYPGMIPMTEDQPNLIPQQLNRLMSRRYARRLTLVRILASCSEMPAGKALRLFFPFLLDGRPSKRVAGTVSKYGS